MADVTHYSIEYMSESTNRGWLTSTATTEAKARPADSGSPRCDSLTALYGERNVGGLAVVNFPMARFGDGVAILRNEERIVVGHPSGGPDNTTSEGISSFTAARLRP